MFFDTHVHFDEFVEDRTLSAVLDRAANSNVSNLLAVGGSPKANQMAQHIAENYPDRIYASAGYDRDLAGTSNDFEALRNWVTLPSTVAIGEIGLDYFYESEKAKKQQKLFSQCLDIATNNQKPVIIHTRDADDDTLAMLTEFSNQWKGDPSRIGVLHCFTRNRNMASALLDIGFYISLSGIITFTNATALREIATYLPTDRLLIETDSPYLAPVPHRGKRCEPAWVVNTAKRLAELRGDTIESLAKTTMKNAVHLFGLDLTQPQAATKKCRTRRLI